MNASEMWTKYCNENNIDINTRHDIWKFCGGGEVGDKLVNLVLTNKKRATASLKLAFQLENEQLPYVGCYSIVLFDNDEAACIIKDTKVSIVPFSSVSDSHAKKEGEGDLSLTYWRKVHKEFFMETFKKINKEFDENSECVLEEFEVVFC